MPPTLSLDEESLSHPVHDFDFDFNNELRFSFEMQLFRFRAQRFVICFRCFVILKALLCFALLCLALALAVDAHQLNTNRAQSCSRHHPNPRVLAVVHLRAGTIVLVVCVVSTTPS